MNTKKLCPLIDADILLYRCGFAADSGIKKDLKQKGLTSEQIAEAMGEADYVHHALGNVKIALEDIMLEFPEAPWRKVYLTGKDNFRDTLATIQVYKGNRDPTHKPKYYSEMKDYLVEHQGAIVVDGQEADDAMAIEQFSHKDKSTVICTIDKDLDMVPGWHYNNVKGELYYVPIDEANYNFFHQMLTGDRVDNIQGIPGTGPKTADKLLAPVLGDIDAMQKVVKEAYRKHYGEFYDQAYWEHAQLLWMRRKEDQVCPF